MASADAPKGILSVLQPDLRALALGARRKHEGIKEAAERAIERLRRLEERHKFGVDQNSEYIAAVAESPEILQPFTLALDSKVDKMVALAMGSIQKLVAHKAVSLPNIKKLLRYLKAYAAHGSDSVQLKTLQVAVAILTSDMKKMDQVALTASLEVCFRLQACKNQGIRNTAAAALRQVISMMFDTAAGDWAAYKQAQGSAEGKAGEGAGAGGKEMSGEEEMKKVPSMWGAYQLLRDLCCLTVGDMPAWIRMEQLDPNFGLELIEAVLAAQPQLLSTTPAFLELLRDRVCPLVVQLLKGSKFPTLIRVQRTILVLVRHYSGVLVAECEMYLTATARLLGDRKELWVQAVALESLRELSNSSQLMGQLCQRYDMTRQDKSKGVVEGEEANLFFVIIAALGVYVQTMYGWDEKGLKYFKYHVRCLDQLAATEPPVLTDRYVVTLALESLLGCVNSIEVFCDSGKESDKELAVVMSQLAWPSMLPAFEMLLARTDDEELVHAILQGYQSFTHSCGMLGLQTPRGM